VRNHVDAVRRARAAPAAMGAGLWVAAQAAQTLRGDPAALERFRAALKDAHLDLFTLNGFPYGNFHAAAVKTAVYLPDWSDAKRYAYTLNLAGVLAELLPAERAFGTISTLPLGYGALWNDVKHAQALEHLVRLAGDLAALREATGKRIVVCLEMEPDCALQRTEQMLGFFGDDLPAAARRHDMPMEIVNAHLGLCFDTCHQAVMFEDCADSLAQLRHAGITIGKIQLSSALELTQPGSAEALNALAAFDEPRYLHQVKARHNGAVVGVIDLPAALQGSALPTDGVWRVHFHVPIQARLDGQALRTTQPAIHSTLDYLATDLELSPHLEVETYTWNVLPLQLRPTDDAALHAGLAGEIDWLQAELAQRGLL